MDTALLENRKRVEWAVGGRVKWAMRLRKRWVGLLATSLGLGGLGLWTWRSKVNVRPRCERFTNVFAAVGMGHGGAGAQLSMSGDQTRLRAYGRSDRELTV